MSAQCPFRSALASMFMPASLVAGLLILATAVRTSGEPVIKSDQGLDGLLRSHPSEKAKIRELDAALSADSVLATSLLGYCDSLSANPTLAKHERALLHVLESDSLLNKYLVELEQLAARTRGSLDHFVELDSIMAARPEVATGIQEVERLAAARTETLERHLGSLAFLWALPQEGEIFFWEEEGPTVRRSDRNITAYADYLREYPELYQAWWILYMTLWADGPLAEAVLTRWRWFQPRPPLQRAYWRFRLWAARDADAHRIICERRLYLGAHPELARVIGRYRLDLACRPAGLQLCRYLLNHPEIASALASYRRGTRRQ